MLLEFFQPAANGQLLPMLTHTTPDPLAGFQMVPMNLTAEEIRAMVREVLG